MDIPPMVTQKAEGAGQLQAEVWGDEGQCILAVHGERTVGSKVGGRKNGDQLGKYLEAGRCP